MYNSTILGWYSCLLTWKIYIPDLHFPEKLKLGYSVYWIIHKFNNYTFTAFLTWYYSISSSDSYRCSYSSILTRIGLYFFFPPLKYLPNLCNYINRFSVLTTHYLTISCCMQPLGLIEWQEITLENGNVCCHIITCVSVTQLRLKNYLNILKQNIFELFGTLCFTWCLIKAFPFLKEEYTYISSASLFSLLDQHSLYFWLRIE